MIRGPRARYALAVILVGVSCAVASAACGSSGHKPAASSNSQLILAQCMRSHGVPNFPDPTKGPGGGEGFRISSTPGSQTLTVDSITFSGPAFVSAEKTCKLFGGGSAPPPVSESQKLALFHFAECMRSHGVSNYPDPTFPAGGGVDLGNTPMLDSPATRHAAAACRGH